MAGFLAALLAGVPAPLMWLVTVTLLVVAALAAMLRRSGAVGNGGSRLCDGVGNFPGHAPGRRPGRI